MNRSAYKCRKREIDLAVEAVAVNSCEMLLEKAVKLKKKKQLGWFLHDVDGLLPLPASYGMQWLKRGKTNDWLTGHGAIMGARTK